MAIYCFRCGVCGAAGYEGFEPDGAMYECQACGCGPLLRDYKAEGVGLTGMLALKREREGGGKENLRNLFLPTAEDYMGPDDPDGSKGLKKWNEEHVPKAGNNRPLRPVVPKESF